MGVVKLSTWERMFYPAGEEPDDSSEDERYMLNVGREEPSSEAKPLCTWNGKPSKESDQPLMKKDHVFPQTSMMNEDFRIAVVKGDVDRVKSLLDSGFDVETRLKGGWTALMYACEAGNSSIIQLVLENGANPNSHKDTYTALMCLCACKNHYITGSLTTSASLLIEKGARVNARDRHYMSPLMYACQVGHVNIAEVLVSYDANVNYQDTQGWSALCYAAAIGSDPLVNLLLKNGGDPKIATHLGDTPSSLASASGFTCLAEMLDASTAPATLQAPSASNITNEQKGVATASAGNTSDTRKLGDMELFLAGLKLRHLETTFQSHCVDFPHLLTLTDKDLDEMGITQIGVKKTLLDAITDLHKASWKMPDKPFEIRRGLSIQEYSAVLCQLVTHIEYVAGSSAFLVNHTKTSTGHSPLTMVTSEDECRDLMGLIDSVVKASKKLSVNVSTLEKDISKGLGRATVGKKLFSARRVGLSLGLALCGLAICSLLSSKSLSPFKHVHHFVSTVLGR